MGEDPVPAADSIDPKARIRIGYRKIRVLLAREDWAMGEKLEDWLYLEEEFALNERPSDEVAKERAASCHLLGTKTDGDPLWH